MDFIDFGDVHVRRWLRFCLPEFVQMKKDVEDGNGFVGCFLRIGLSEVDMSIVFRSESSWHQLNRNSDSLLQAHIRDRVR